jgi:hypothetical protein
VGEGLAGEVDVEVGSLHPNQPGVKQVVLETEVLVDVGVLVGVEGMLVIGRLLEVVVFSSLHPNHPGVLQVEVDVIVVDVLVVVPVVVVVSSRHPHHPGV